MTMALLGVGPGLPPSPFLHDPLMISDNDFGDDCENALQRAMQWAAMYFGECTILASTCSQNDASAISDTQEQDYYGFSSVPVGRCTTTTDYTNEGFVATMAAQYPSRFSGNYLNIPDAVTVMRAVLAAAARNSITLFCAAPETNISALLNSVAHYGGDGYSTGLSLIEHAVLRLVIMGGDYPNGAEFNFQTDPVSANNVFANFPRPIICLGYTLGALVQTGALMWANRPPCDITTCALYAELGQGGTRDAWDEMAFLYAIRGITGGPHNYNYYAVNGPGVNSVNSSTGANAFVLSGPNTGIINYATGTGNHYYLTQGTATGAQILADINALNSSAVSPAQPTPLWFVPINETSGTTLADITGNHSAMTISGSTPPTFGDHYLDFSGSTSGSNGEATLPDASCLDLAFTSTEPFTMVVSGARQAGGGDFQAIMHRSRDGSPNGTAGIPAFYGIFSGTANSEVIQGTICDSNTVHVTNGVDGGVGVWFTVCSSMDPANSLTVVQDCVAASNTAASLGRTTTSQAGLNVGGLGGTLGIGNCGAVNQYSVFDTGNCRIYGSVLTLAQGYQCHVEPIEAYTAVNGATVSVVAPLYLRPTFTTDATGWYVTVNGSPRAVTGATASGQTITLTLATAVTAGQTVVMGYFGGATVDATSQRLLNFGNFAVTNNV